ncbi:MAG: hypothetical protein KFH98_04145 [Gemmatimonadetes bacterium]|nr:hypothetical protein [Gemmatimonadota bacterium]
MIRKLLASLLVLPFLLGANVEIRASTGFAVHTGASAYTGASAPCPVLEACAGFSACHAADLHGSDAAGPYRSSSATPHSLDAVGTPVAQPPAPGHAAFTAFTAPVHLSTHGSGTWRTPTRAGQTRSDPPAALRPRDAHTLIDRLRRDSLDFAFLLALMRSNEPASFGNPPPVSQA